jgi:glutamine synthetase
MIAPVPWARVPTAQVVGELRDLSNPQAHFCDPRAVLHNVVERFSQDGLQPVVACELEFYLVEPKRDAKGQLIAAPPPGVHGVKASNLSLDTVSQAEPFLSAIQKAAEIQGLPVSSVVSEYGVGQYEVNLQHVASPLQAADHAVLLKRLIKGVARQFGLEATFMAKPFLDQPGNGLHLHISLLNREGQNVFAGSVGDQRLAEAVAGLQAMTIESVGLMAPNFNSFRRFKGDFVPVGREWGQNNRSVAFRLPLALDHAKRIEHRIAGADASPHLVLAATLAGMHWGLSQQLTPTEPLVRTASLRNDEEFPRELAVALHHLERATLLSQYVDKRFLQAFVHNRRGEFSDMMAAMSAEEVSFYA